MIIGESPDDDATSPIVQIDSMASITLVEGLAQASIPISVVRALGNSNSVTLEVRGETIFDEKQLSFEFEQNELEADESSTNLIVSLAIGPKPIQSHTRTLLLSANDGVSQATETMLNITVEPTDQPDIYLIVGQSNAVGNSKFGAKMSLAGEPDAPNDRIQQLNVTGNDQSNFSEPADFELAPNLYNTGEPITPALDPLHSGYETSESGGGKTGTKIGFGLSFAKAALQNTSADIILVPAAWSDTGFCNRGDGTSRVVGLGWNAIEKTETFLSGTLLHDRAIARTNIAISLTGGILRGILWHQGEADSEDEDCAQMYLENLQELATSLRTNIDADARGSVARGSESDIPFIVGTMSKGEDLESSELNFSATKREVDTAHRTVAIRIPMSGFVNNDNLVPPAYECGDGGCIHFGATALREMGVLYYDKMISVLE